MHSTENELGNANTSGWLKLVSIGDVIKGLKLHTEILELNNEAPCLSPVSTQILISALVSCSIVWATPSWSLSSTAVAPINYTKQTAQKHFSIIFYKKKLTFWVN